MTLSLPVDQPEDKPGYFVSVVVPCFNEENTITNLLDSILQQTYPLNLVEVIIADGMSEDDTRFRINDFQLEHPELSILLVDNPQRVIPIALNLAILASKGDIILRLDAHCHPMKGYIQRSVAGLIQGKGKNIGGMWIIHPGAKTWLADSIAISAAHPLAVGDAFYRFSNKSGEVDTVPFGAFWKDYLLDIGKYNEDLLTNEDYELNTRIRKRGDKVWYDPEIQSIYYARSDLKGLAKQYWRYGYWKYKMLRKHPDSLRLRQAIPPVFVIGWIILIIGTLFSWYFQIMLISMVLLYVLILLMASLPSAIRAKKFAYLAGIPLSIATMHLCWGAGFLWSIFK